MRFLLTEFQLNNKKFKRVYVRDNFGRRVGEQVVAALKRNVPKTAFGA